MKKIYILYVLCLSSAITMLQAQIVHTVYFEAGAGVCETTTLTQGSPGAAILLPSSYPTCTDWTFAGWITGGFVTETNIKPVFVVNPYTPTSNLTLYAVYKKITNPDIYSLVTSDLQIEDEKKYIITAAKNSGTQKAMQLTTTGNFQTTIDINISGTDIDISITSATAWTLHTHNSIYKTFLSGGRYLYSTLNQTYLRTKTTVADDCDYTISINPTTYVASINARVQTTRYINYNGSTDFRTYVSTPTLCYLFKEQVSITYHSNPTCASSLINAQTPIINTQPTDTTITTGATVNLTVSVTSPDGGALSYQWYSNTSATNIGGTLLSGKTDTTLAVSIDTVGIYYYYVVVTNTIKNNGDGGIKTASAISDAATVTVNPDIHIITPVCPPVCYDTINHILYETIEILGLCMFKENMRGTLYQDGSAIPFARPYYHPLNPASTQYAMDYGLLYDYVSAFPDETARRICPDGWRIPTSEEWALLNVYDTKELKNPIFWLTPNENTNHTEVDLRGAGCYNGNKQQFENLYGLCAFWTSDTHKNSIATCARSRYYCNRIEIVDINKTDAISIRCIQE